MFEHAAESPDGDKRGLEASAVVAAAQAPARSVLDKSGEAAPARARRMGHDGPRAAVVARVALFAPRVDAGQAVVNAALLDVERGDLLGHATTFTRSPQY